MSAAPDQTGLKYSRTWVIASRYTVSSGVDFEVAALVRFTQLQRLHSAGSFQACIEMGSLPEVYLGSPVSQATNTARATLD